MAILAGMVVMNMQIMHLVLIAIRLFHIALEHVMQNVQQQILVVMVYVQMMKIVQHVQLIAVSVKIT